MIYRSFFFGASVDIDASCPFFVVESHHAAWCGWLSVPPVPWPSWLWILQPFPKRLIHRWSHEWYAYGRRCQSEETATYAHKLQRFLQSLEHRVSFLIHCRTRVRITEEQRLLLFPKVRWMIQPPMVSMMVWVFTSRSPFCIFEMTPEGTDQNDNGSNGLHQVRYRSLVELTSWVAFGKPAAPLLPANTLDGK